jgi:hypothetical protein
MACHSLRATHYSSLFIIGLIVAILTAIFQPAPGYMDAEYYYAGGIQLVEGQGFNEPFLWNYLDDPSALPHPSHAYWMPLASLLAALGMAITGIHQFSAARLFLIFLTACLPPLTAALTYSFQPKRQTAWLAGLLAIFPGFYLTFLVTTDTFAIYSVLGGLFFISAHFASSVHLTTPYPPRLLHASLPLMFGLLAGLMHLSRADGVLWLFAALLMAAPMHWMTHRKRFFLQVVSSVFLCILGYLLIMAPWLMRNLSVFGGLLPAGGGRTLWLTDYDDLFIFPAALLTPARWWASGIGEILRARLWALGSNLQTAFAVQGEIFLAPLILAGAWRLRGDRRVRLGALMWLLIFIVMTLLFPFAGARGGLFHSGAAVQPLFWALAAVGLDVFVEWGGKRRGWQMERAHKLFAAGLVGLAILLTAVTAYPKLAHWGQNEAINLQLEVELRKLGVAPGEVVMVNNPPGYYLATDRAAIPIPDGDVAMALAAAEKYHAQWLMLDENYPQGMKDLYHTPRDWPGLRYVETFGQTQLFKIGE